MVNLSRKIFLDLLTLFILNVCVCKFKVTKLNEMNSGFLIVTDSFLNFGNLK